MKMDKEFLMKHRFWVLLSVAVPLTLVTVVFLMFVAPVGTAALKKKVETAHKDLKKFDRFKNPKWVKQAEKELKEVKKLEKSVWEVAWKDQERLFTWPGPLDDKFREGYYVKLITIFPPETKAEALTPAATKDDGSYTGVFHGVLTAEAMNYDENWVKVRGLGTGDKQPRMFLNPGTEKPATITVSGKDADKKLFAELSLFKDHKVVILFERGRSFGDDLTQKERDTFATKLNLDQDKLPAFQMQVPDILNLVDPLNELGEPLVQFKNWVYSKKPAELFFNQDNATVPGNPMPQPGMRGRPGEVGGAAVADNRGPFGFFPYVPREWKQLSQNKVYNSSKDAWTYQENLWVTSAIYRQLKHVNDQVAAFHDRGRSKDDPQAQVFENPYWRLEIKLLSEGKVHVTIKNLLDRRQKLPVLLKVQFDSAKSKFVKLPALKSPPLGARGIIEEVGGQKKHKDTYSQELDLSDEKVTNPKKVIAVKQVLNWETAAVKRIDALHLGTPLAQSHRAANKPLVIFPAFVDKKQEEATKAADPMGEKPGPGGKGPARVGGPGADLFETTENGMILKRYLGVTPQSRRLPVAVVVIADQEQAYRIQAALADCKFRFLTTQVVMNRCPESMRPPKKAEDMAGEAPPGIRPPGRQAEDEQAGGNQDETNVELVIYGVITLYERYPPRVTTSGS